jgi:hypothetical protein
MHLLEIHVKSQPENHLSCRLSHPSYELTAVILNIWGQTPFVTYV